MAAALKSSLKQKPAVGQDDDRDAKAVKIASSRKKADDGSKKRKSRLVDGDGEQSPGDGDLTAKTKENIGSEAASIPERPTKRRKSVSFAPDTKADEDTSNDQAYNAQPDSEAVNSKGSRGIDSPIEHGTGDGETEQKERKKPKKPKSSSKAEKKARNSAADQQQGPSAVLEYLNLFHNDRAKWKFSKARQNQLFKQLLDPHKIPSSYDDALCAYIGGLQSGAAREQLRLRAAAVREQDAKDGLEAEDSMEESGSGSGSGGDRATTDTERHRAAYRAALRRVRAGTKWRRILEEEEELQLSEEWELRLRRRARVERLFGPLAETLDTDRRKAEGVDFEVSRVLVKTVRPDGTVVGEKRRRRRKRRTAVADDDSSEDESSSSEDDDSDAEATAKRLRLAAPTVEAESSSSSGSSSGSDGDDDDGSGDGDEDEDDDEESTSSSSGSESTSSDDDSD